MEHGAPVMERPPVKLTIKTIEERSAGLLSQNARKEQKEQEETGGDQETCENLLDTFKFGSAWAETKTGLAEAFSDLLDTQAMREAFASQDQALEGALDAVEEAYLDFHKVKNLFPAKEGQSDSTSPLLHQCILKFDKLDDVFAQAKQSFFNVPHLPRLAYLAAHILQAYLSTEPSADGSAMAEDVFGKINDQIQTAMEGVFRERHQRISLRLSGPFDNLVYIYDDHTKASLTQWVEFSEKAPSMQLAHQVLQERIADRYVESKPFDHVGKMVTQFWEQGEAVSWAAVKKHCLLIDLADAAYAEHANAIRELALDGVKSSYFPEFSTSVQFIAPASLNMEDMLNELLSRLLDGFLKPQRGGRLAAVLASHVFVRGFHGIMLGIVGRIINIIRSELSDQDSAMTRLIQAWVLTEIRLRFTDCFTAYENRFQSVKGNTNPATRWGATGDWDTALLASRRLEDALLGHVLLNQSHGMYYQTHLLLSEAVVMRLNILLGAWESGRVAGNQAFLNGRRSDIETLMSRWYAYLNQLLQQSYNRTRGSNGDIIQRGGSLFYPQRYAYDDLHRTRVSQRGHETNARIARYGVRHRIDFFVTLNTELHNFCRAWDTTDDILRQRGILPPRTVSSPSATRDIFGQLMNNYTSRGNQLVNESTGRGTWPGATAEYSLLLFSRQEYRRGPRHQDHGVTLLPSNVTLSVGDYADLESSEVFRQNLSGSRDIRVPMGFVATVFPQKNFQGGSQVIPMPNTSRWDQHSLNMTVRSMKVRIDVGNRWFHSKPHHHLGRIDSGFWYWPGRWDNPVSPPLINLP